MKGKDLILVVMSVLLIAESALLYYQRKKKPLERIKYVERVITKTDTIKVAEPYEIIKERKVSVHDTLLVPVRDTIWRKDTLFVPVQREFKTYADENYRAVVSGYQPRLESIDIYKQTEIVEVRKPTKWALGIGVTYGATFEGGRLVFKPMIGASITRTLIAW